MNKLSSIIFAAILIPASVFAYTSPGKATGFVSDFANVISVPERQAMESQLDALEKSTGAQVAVVTIPALGDETIETYAVKLFEEWGIGQKGKDNGLLILVATNDHEARIEVGYGLEGTVTDLQAGNIVTNVMIPAFRAGKYDEGIQGAVQAVSAIITGSPEASNYSTPPTSSVFSDWNVNPFAIFFILVIFVNILTRVLGKTKSWWLGGVIGAGIGAIIGVIIASVAAGVIAAVVFTVFGLIFDFIVSKRPPGANGGRGGGIWPIFLGGGRGGFGGGSFGGGGGFGGFGGGMSGGGGAGGRW